MPEYFICLAGVSIRVLMPHEGFRSVAKDYLTKTCEPDITV